MWKYTLRWVNGSDSEQYWNVNQYDQFTLQSGFMVSADVTLYGNCTFGVTVGTDNAFTSAMLAFSAATTSFSLNSNPLYEWRFNQSGTTITIKCYLEASINTSRSPDYQVSAYIQDETANNGKYPAYQCYQDSIGTVYCSSYRVNDHTEGAAWVKACLLAHEGTSFNGRPWLSQTLEGTVWPD